MLLKKLLLAALALLCLGAAWFRPVCALSVDGAALPGLWELGDAAAALRMASAAASEAARGDCPEPELAAEYRLAFGGAGGGALDLARELLAAAPGVERGWDVYVDGERIGRAADRSALGEVLMAAIAEAVPPDSARTGFASEIELREAFGSPGSCDSLMELSRELRGLLRVVYASPDGELHYV